MDKAEHRYAVRAGHVYVGTAQISYINNGFSSLVPLNNNYYRIMVRNLMLNWDNAALLAVI